MLDVASAKIDRFGWANMDAALKDALRRDWVETLEVFELPEVRAGIDRVFREAKGQVRSINEHQVRAAIIANREAEYQRLPRKHEPPKEPPVDRVSPEAAAEILAKAGYDPKRFK